MAGEQDDKMCNARHTHWFTVAVFSVIALVSMTSEFEDEIDDEKREVKWAVSAVSISLVFSALGVFANIVLQDKFVGTVMEGGMAFLICAFWAAVMPAIMAPGNDLAVLYRFGGIGNPNLYFFSWGAFIMSFYLLFHFMNEMNYKGEPMSHRGYMMHAWTLLLFTSFVVMISAARLYEDFECEDSKDADVAVLGFLDENVDVDAVCGRTKYAVSVGTISTVVSLLWMAISVCMKGRFHNMMGLLLVVVMLIFWTFGIAYITFNDDKPIRDIGNLYFFTWGSFSICVAMLMKHFYHFMEKEETTEEEKKEEMKDEKAEAEEQPKEGEQESEANA